MTDVLHNKKNEVFRLKIYQKLGYLSKTNDVKWVVLHGVEKYPDGIGRDLDVMCRSEKDTHELLTQFSSCLKESYPKWIIFPNPLWGRRILGVSYNYEVAELHVFDKLRSFNIDQEVEWASISFVDNIFPIYPLARYFKGCLMPALANQDNWKIKCCEVPRIFEVPFYLKCVSKKLDAGVSLNVCDKILLFFVFQIFHPYRSFKNIIDWLLLKYKLFHCPTVPVYLINKCEVESVVRLVGEELNELFLGVQCVDGYNTRTIKKIQSLQKFLYTTKTNSKIKTVFVDSNLTDDATLDFIVDTFSGFSNCYFENKRH